MEFLEGKLLEDLYQRTLIALGGTQPDAGAILAQRKQQATKEAHALGVSDEQRDALWHQLDVAYFLRHEANEIAWHTEQIASRLHDPEPLVRARVIGHNEALQVMVYSQDKTDLFASVCRYFDRRTLSVQDARVHTTRHGWALDSFIVLFTKHEAQYQEHIGSVQRELAAYLRDPRPVKAGPNVSYRRTGRRERRRARVFPVVPQLDLRPQEPAGSWRLSIVCADRPGLLYDLARVFSVHQISLKMAKIHTLGERAEDVFILESEQLADTRARSQFERAVLAALNGA